MLVWRELKNNGVESYWTKIGDEEYGVQQLGVYWIIVLNDGLPYGTFDNFKFYTTHFRDKETAQLFCKALARNKAQSILLDLGA